MLWQGVNGRICADTSLPALCVPSQSRCGSPLKASVLQQQGQQAAFHSSPRKTRGVLAVIAMARIPITAVLAALLLMPASASLAQDTPAQEQPSQSRPLERMEGVPDNFSLQPKSDPVRRNSDEPMVQPLPQPSATPTAARAAPPVAVPQVIPTPQLTMPAREAEAVPSQRRSATTERTGVREQSGPAEVDPPAPQATAPEQAVSPPQEVASAVEPSIPESAEGEAAEPAFDWSIAGWLLFAGLGLAVLAVGVWWWRRRRSDAAFVVEKIEPYRPSADEAAHIPSPSTPALWQSADGRTSKPSGLIHTSRPVATANPGGFVTSSITTRPRSQNPTEPATQAPRRFTSPDGRIVTSLSSTRRSRD